MNVSWAPETVSGGMNRAEGEVPRRAAAGPADKELVRVDAVVSQHRRNLEVVEDLRARSRPPRMLPGPRKYFRQGILIVNISCAQVAVTASGGRNREGARTAGSRAASLLSKRQSGSPVAAGRRVIQTPLSIFYMGDY